MQTLHVHSLLKNGSDRHLVIDTQQPLGAGSQGIIYPVLGTDQVVKLYANPAAKRYLVPLVRHVQANRLAENCASLAGLPRDVFTTDEGSIGVVMNRVPGQSLELTGYKPLKELSLSQRLAVVYGLARGVAALHNCGVVLADLAEANVMYEPQQNQAFLIDIDGGGIMHGPHYRLKPAVWGHDCGSLMPVEIRHRRHLPSLASDNWTLAVLFHRALSRPPGADPFFFGQDHRILDGDLLWPPSPDHQPAAQQPLLAQHRTSLARLGPQVREAFKNTFCPLGRHHPEHRVKAQRWVQVLERAARWVYRCPTCGQEFVAEQSICCLFCHAPIRHALLATGKEYTLLQHEPRTLTWHQLGLGHSREIVLRWERRHAHIVVHVLAGILSVRCNQYFQVLRAGDCYQLGPGVYCCRFQGMGTDEVTFRLVNPWGPWVKLPALSGTRQERTRI